MEIVGLIVPDNNFVIEREFRALALQNISFEVTKLNVKSKEEGGILKMLEGIGGAAREISLVRPNLIAYCCLSSSFVKGPSWDNQLREEIQRESGVPTFTAATAMIKALKTFEVKRVATLSAYNDELNRAMVQFLSNAGFNIVNSIGMNLPIDEIGMQTPQKIHDKALKAFTRDAECLFIGSTDLPALGLVEELEAELDVPVVSINQAILKSILVNLELDVRLHSFGKLLRVH